MNTYKGWIKHSKHSFKFIADFVRKGESSMAQDENLTREALGLTLWEMRGPSWMREKSHLHKVGN